MGQTENMIFSIFGALRDDAPEGMALSSLITMLEALGFSPDATRVALSRMARKGFFITKRQGRSSYYIPSEKTLSIIGSAESKSVTRTETSISEWNGLFRIVSYEIPEKLRDLRISFSNELKSIGYVRAASGMWIGAFDLPSSIVEKIETSPLEGKVDRYSAEYIGDVRAFARKTWNLDIIRKSIDSYVKTTVKRIETFSKKESAGKPLRDSECFAGYFESLDEFVCLMSGIPPVPKALLPEDWPADEAMMLFRQYRSSVHNGAQRFVDSVLVPYRAGGSYEKN